MNLIHDLESASVMAMPPVAAAVLILVLSLWERALKAPLPEVELPGSGRSDAGAQRPFVRYRRMLEPDGQRDQTANIRHLVIKNAVVGLTCRQGGDGTGSEKFRDAVIRGQGQDLAHVQTISQMVVA
jgi:hypothetical protein